MFEKIRSLHNTYKRYSRSPDLPTNSPQLLIVNVSCEGIKGRCAPFWVENCAFDNKLDVKKLYDVQKIIKQKPKYHLTMMPIDYLKVDEIKAWEFKLTEKEALENVFFCTDEVDLDSIYTGKIPVVRNTDVNAIRGNFNWDAIQSISVQKKKAELTAA